MTTINTNCCPFCHALIKAVNPLRSSGAHDLGCARCYRTSRHGARLTRMAHAGYRLEAAR